MIPSSSLLRRSFVVLLATSFAINQIYRFPSALDSAAPDSPLNCGLDALSTSIEEYENGTKAIADSAETESPTSLPLNCKAVVRRMQEWNDCWRRHLMTMKDQSPNSTSSLRQDNFLCHIAGDSSSTNEFEVVGAPMYHFAYYQGQGFGRAVSHSVEACLTAFVLGRPCVVNLSPRDPFYTWRSFIQAQTYQWDPSLLHSLPEYAEQLERLAQELPSLGANEWDRKTFNASKFERQQSLVFPMQRKFGRHNWVRAVEYYHANNTVNGRGKQVLFSPNWANAWFTIIPLDKIYHQQYRCNYDVLKTHMQNAMYGPTDLSLELHQTRLNRAVDSGSWKNVNPVKHKTANENKNSKDTAIEGRIMPHTTTSITSLHAADNRDNFGSIHLRMHFLNLNRKIPLVRGEVVTMVRRCLHQASRVMPANLEFPKNWWLLADDVPMAVDFPIGMAARQETQLAGSRPESPLFDPTIPIVNIFHDYNITRNVKKSSKELSSLHSMGAETKGLFRHPNMAGAIEDWMALYSSKISIVVHDGSFGTTGSRGKGKSPRGYCGGEGRQSPSVHPFQIFF